ncbi:MAG TPA: protein translocase subunit SecD [Gaiellaceae bacterium]|nr:protein translocase subunit SecD [Gaiellaceae bacterium]
MSDRRSHLSLVAAIVAALIGVALLAIPQSPIHKKINLGLDLQGGLEVVLQAVPPKGHSLNEDDITRSVEIMRARVDKLGVSEPEIRKQGNDQIVIQLPGVKDPRKALEIIGKTAQLWLFDLQANIREPTAVSQGFVTQPQPSTNLFQLLKAIQPRAKNGSPTEYYLVNPETKKVILGPENTVEQLKQSYQARFDKPMPKNLVPYGVPEKTIILNCGIGERYCPGTNEQPPTRNYYYLFKYDPDSKTHPVPEMTGADLKLDGTRSDISQTEGPIVLMQFTGKGGDKFHKITRDLAARGQAAEHQVGHDAALQSFAIVLDREIKSAPTVDWNQNPDGIAGGSAEITGIGDIGEAKDLALVLQTGALPVEFKQIDRTDVSATLGKDSLDQAKRAAIGGLLLVAIFLLLFYRFLGLVAVAGLAIYAAFLYAALLLFNVTLTLPGFAGLILTIGVAADANVVIFERIKEEVRAGKSVRAAIAAGYSKGFHTIVDANVVTAITALVLFSVATASVKGFALMLLIGTAISMVTAIAATRALLGLLANFRWFDNPRFMGAAGAQGAKWLQIDFMRRRWIWLGISGVVVVIAIGSLAVKGLNLGIDFRGGTQIVFQTSPAKSLDDVRSGVADLGQGKAVLQGRGQSQDGKYSRFQLRTEELSRTGQEQLSSQLRSEFGGTIVSVENVSSSFGRQIAKGAIIAIIVSLLLIVAYVSFRFDFKYAVPIIAALIHDVLITVGIYSLTGREVTTATVAAVLTVLGYSIYDTIIIFDRIRENVPLMRRASFATIANVSLWETIRRSLATTFITLLPVGSLLFFGGDTLKDFAFALLIGIGSGAYSSIFIAAPLLTMWKEREPEWERKKHLDGDGALEGAVATQVVEEAAAAAADEPAPDLPPPVAPTETKPVLAGGDSKREQRRQRRRARPHGRAR